MSLYVRAMRPLALGIGRLPLLRRLLGWRRSLPVDGVPLDDALAAMLGLDDFMHESDLRGRKPADARAQLARSSRIVDGPPVPGVAVRPGTLAGRPARHYEPAGLAGPSPGLLFLHGGGWVCGDLDTHDRICRRIAAVARVRVAALDYRLAPEHPYPAAVEDAVAGFRALVADAARLELDPARLGVAGDSAGGNLSAVVARRLRGQPGAPRVAGLIYPAVDLTCSSRSHVTYGDGYMLTGAMIGWYLDHYLGRERSAVREADVSPLLADDVGGECAHVVHTAGFDPLRDEAERYAERLAAAGVRVKVQRHARLLHGFASMSGVSPACESAVEAIARDLGEALRA